MTDLTDLTDLTVTPGHAGMLSGAPEPDALRYLRFLLAFGLPDLIETPRGPYPVVSVELSRASPWRVSLEQSFGGQSLRETPAGWTLTPPTRSRPGAEAVGVTGAAEPEQGLADDATPGERVPGSLRVVRGPGSTARVGALGGPSARDDDALDLVSWCAVGDAAFVVAALFEARVEDLAIDEVDHLAVEAWLPFLNACRLLRHVPADAAGKRPKAAYQEIRRATTTLRRAHERMGAWCEAEAVRMREALQRQLTSGASWVKASLRVPDAPETQARVQALVTLTPSHQQEVVPGDADLAQLAEADAVAQDLVRRYPIPTRELDRALAEWRRLEALDETEREAAIEAKWDLLIEEQQQQSEWLPSTTVLWLIWTMETWEWTDVVEGRAFAWSRQVVAALGPERVWNRVV
jgi:hypothetical protein